MSDCASCPVEKDCFYPYKPCDCVHQRKFWSKEERVARDPAFKFTEKAVPVLRLVKGES